MSRALSDDLRQRVIEAVDGGMSRRGAARRFGIGEATANRWVRRWRRSGSWSADKRGPKSPRSPLAGCHDELLALVGQRPGLTLNQIVAYLAEELGVQASKSALDRFFARHKITYKKRQRTPVSRSGRM